MTSLFNIIRACIYGTVLLFTFICLAMACDFLAVLEPSDLTRFVPFAIFICSASLFVFVILLAFSFFFRGRNPISTRIELAFLALAGVFWLVLGTFLVTSDSQEAEVECFADSTSTTPLADNLATFHTVQYQEMYRVLMTFSLMNAVIILLSALLLLGLAIRRHRNGDNHMWHGPVTSCAWFNDYENSKPQRSKSDSSSVLPIVSEHRQPSPRRVPEKTYNAGSRPRREHQPREKQVDQTQQYAIDDFNNGMMQNPGWLGRSRRS